MLAVSGSRPSILPLNESVLGSVLIADISGFTKLGEKLRNRYGEGEGAAKLAKDIDTVLSEFIMCVYAYGGDIVKFAGDAIICVFLGGEDDRVNNPAKYMKDSLERCKKSAVSLINLVGDDSPLNMHGGICWGEIQFLRVGKELPEPGTAMFMMAGHCVEEAGRALEETTKGQVKVFNTGEILFGDTLVDFDEKELEALSNEQLTQSSRAVKGSTNLPGHAVSYASLLSHQRLFQAINKVARVELATDDIRTVSVLFVSLPDLEADYNNSTNLHTLNTIFETLTEITYKYTGFCRDFLFEDKGCTFIAIFGAMKRGESDEVSCSEFAKRREPISRVLTVPIRGTDTSVDYSLLPSPVFF